MRDFKPYFLVNYTLLQLIIEMVNRRQFLFISALVGGQLIANNSILKSKVKQSFTPIIIILDKMRPQIPKRVASEDISGLGKAVI